MHFTSSYLIHSAQVELLDGSERLSHHLMSKALQVWSVNETPGLLGCMRDLPLQAFRTSFLGSQKEGAYGQLWLIFERWSFGPSHGNWVAYGLLEKNCPMKGIVVAPLTQRRRIAAFTDMGDAQQWHVGDSEPIYIYIEHISYIYIKLYNSIYWLHTIEISWN